MLTYNSTLSELYNNPIGRDIMDKLLLSMGMSSRLLTNPIIGRRKLKTVRKLVGKKLGDGFFEAFLELLNTEQDRVSPREDGEITRAWWKEAVFYQIYPRSFCDSNGDGVGDLRGIISKLDYLKDLGVDALWLSPIYDSPQDDNGYDIRDYRKICEEFGSLEEFRELLSEVHNREMHLIMDLVVNHTSDEHEWFQTALSEPNSKYRKYYYFRNDTDVIPNNWTSFFSGPAWNEYEENDKRLWALHSFSKKQMDLNWTNPEVREDVIDMIRWWLAMGVDGFRMDVINLISKRDGLPDGDSTIGEMMGVRGIENYFYGPKLHEYLRQIQSEAFAPYNAFSVGETPGLGMNMCRLVTDETRKELDMVFNFDHLESPGHTRFEDYRYDTEYLKKYMIDWQSHYGKGCWMSLFYNNHDNPKMISKISTDQSEASAIGRMLAVLQFTSRGTPFLFQGDEMGLVNSEFRSMDEITDVESKGEYRKLLEAGKTEDEAFAIVLAGTREHGRVLLPWNPSLGVHPERLRQRVDKKLTEIYQDLIFLRKEYRDSLVYGTFQVLRDKKGVFTYERVGTERFVVDINLSNREQKSFEPKKQEAFELVFSTTGMATEKLAPYEAQIWMEVQE